MSETALEGCAKETVPSWCCACCGNGSRRVVFSGVYDYEYGTAGTFDVVTCDDCGVVSISPMPTAAELPAYYPDSYNNFQATGSLITKILLKLTYGLETRRVKALIGTSGRVFDVGCGDGKFLEALQAAGDWELCGNDISATGINLCRDKGFDVKQGVLEEVDFEPGSFDMLRMSHLIEHVVNPRTTLEAAFRFLKPGGFLIGETPNVACRDFSVFGRYWGALHVPRHLHLFTRKTLANQLQKAGFTVNKVASTLHTCGWALGVQNVLVDKKIFRPKQGRVFFYPLLLLGFIPINIVQKLFNNCSIQTFVAEKPR